MKRKGSREWPVRVRYQLVIALGTGEAGGKRRALVDEAARRAGKTSSSWARSVLLKAAGEPDDAEPPSRAELEALEKRVEWLEAHSASGK